MGTDIVAINVSQGSAMLDDGAIVPITTWLDSDGEECESEYAASFVAGAGDHWFYDTVASYGETRQ